MDIPEHIREGLRRFPAEREPDGDRYLGHHLWIGIMLMIVGMMQWTPAGTPVAGAALVWVGVLVALDDLVSHSLGWWTPLNALFEYARERGLR